MKWRVGEVTVTKVVEIEATGGSRFILPRATPEAIVPIGWLQPDLAAIGYPRATIDIVVCTHLHVDHVGWNTMLVEGRWVPTFPNARYLMGRIEFEHWTRSHQREDIAAVLADSVTLVRDAGLVDLVETDHRLCDEVGLVPTLGHTPGHVSVRVTSHGEEALITGDFMHHPCQIARPDWSSTADSDPIEAVAPESGC